MVAREDIESLISRGNALIWGARWRRWLVWGIAVVMVLPALIAVGTEFSSSTLGDTDTLSELSAVPFADGNLSEVLITSMTSLMIFAISMVDIFIWYIPQSIILRRRWQDIQSPLPSILAELGVDVAPPPAQYHTQMWVTNNIIRWFALMIWMYLGSQLTLTLFASVTGYILHETGQSPLAFASTHLMFGIGVLLGYWMVQHGFGIILLNLPTQYHKLLQGILRAEYEPVLAAVATMQNNPKNPNSFTAYLYCYALHSAGHIAEAETTVRATLASLPTLNSGLATYFTICFADIMVLQKGATIESERLLWALARITPDTPIGYHKLAVHYLEHDPKPAQALALSAAAVHFSPRWGWKVGFDRHVMRTNHVYYLAARAWALAANGQFAEADVILSQALAIKLEWNKIAAATSQNIAGRIATLKGDVNAARAHYERAAQVDPNGWEGQQARAALAALT